MNSSLELFSSAKRDDCLDQLQGERYLLINWKRRGVFRSIYGDAGSVRREAATRESHTRSHHQTRPRHCPLPALPLSLLNPAKENSEWEIAPVLHDATNVAGYGIGGLLSAIHGFNTGIPYIQNRVKGPKWLPFVIGLPPLLMYSAASAAFGGYALPKLSQLIVTSYFASSSVSHYGISLFTRHIEDNHISRVQQKQHP